MAFELQKYVKEAMFDRSLSPDAITLTKQYDYVPVFMYGCEKHKMSNYAALGGAQLLGVGLTSRSDMVMYVDRQKNYPVVLDGNSQDGGCIQGEIFIVPTKTVFELDAMYENTVFFERKVIFIRYCAAWQKDEGIKEWKLSPTFMYLGDKDAWHNMKSKLCIQPRHMSKKHGTRYYTYSYEQDRTNKKRDGTLYGEL